MSWSDAGIGAQAGDDGFAAELGDGEGVGAGRFDHLDQAVAFGQRARLAVGAIGIGQRLRADAEDHLFAGIGGQAVIAWMTGSRSGAAFGRSSETSSPPAPFSTVALSRFIAGDPMKSATKRLAGLL